MAQSMSHAKVRGWMVKVVTHYCVVESFDSVSP